MRNFCPECFQHSGYFCEKGRKPLPEGSGFPVCQKAFLTSCLWFQNLENRFETVPF